MQFEQLLDVVLGLLEDLDLVDGDVLEGEDVLAVLLDFFANRIGDQLGDELLQVARGNLASNNLEHLLADDADLPSLGIAGLLDLLRATLGEANAEHAHQVTVRGLDIDVGLNEALPLLNHRAELVLGEGHSVEVGQAGLALNFIDAQAELAESVLLRLGVQVTQAHLEHTSLQTIFRVLQALSAVDESLSDLTDVEHGRSLDVIPVLAGERVNDLLLQSLLTLRQALVLSNSLN